MHATPEALEAWELALLEGQSLNVVGLPGSARSRCVRLLREQLESGGWSTLSWDLADLRTLTRNDKRDAIDELTGNASGVPVLIVDDFGRHLVEPDGRWLDRFLFAALHRQPVGDSEYLRCVLVTAPRDAEIAGPTSGVRERAKVVFPPRDLLGSGHRADSSLPRADGALLTGGSHLLAPRRSVGPNEDRGYALRRAKELAPALVGNLDSRQQQRLASILSRSEPQRWRFEVDEYLVPLVVPIDSPTGLMAVVPEAIRTSGLLSLLVTERWPEYDLDASALRFAARCGDEPSPIWIDNYLSDSTRLDFRLLGRFIQAVLAALPKTTYLRILSRNFVAGQHVNPEQLANKVGPVLDSVLRQVEWRLYDHREVGDLHDRQIILPQRGAAFAIPIVRILVGQRPVGNAADAELLVSDNSPVLNAWTRATALPLAEPKSETA